MASQALKFAVLASEVLGVECVQCAVYAQVAEDLVILFDETLGIHPEYEGYPGNTVKQGDVVLLHYPLGMDMTADVQRADLEYYSERTDHNGPAMTWGMHAIGFLDLQDFTSAAKYFNMSFQDNLHAPLQVWTETVSQYSLSDSHDQSDSFILCSPMVMPAISSLVLVASCRL